MRPNDGLKQKFIVIKADTGELVKNCFVLRPDRDPAAVTALRAYAEVTDNETLAGDIINWIGANKNCDVDIVRKWLYEIALNNVGVDFNGDFSDACEEIISRLDGLKEFARET